MTSTMPRLLVAIPCLNEAATIGSVIAQVPKGIPGIESIDILVVDDASTDDSRSIAASMGAAVEWHQYNRGVGAAFQTAVSYAVEHQYDYLVNIDGDGQFDPTDIPLLLEHVVSGRAEMATASRFIDKSLTPQMPAVKLVGNHIMSWLISRLVRAHFHDVSCGFRCYSREAVLQLNLHGAFTYTQETFLDFASKHLKIVEVPIQVKYFPGRKSRVASSIILYALNTLKIIFRGYRDYFPLRFFGGISLIFAILALIFGSIFFMHYFLYGKFSGYLYAGFASGFFVMLSVVFFVLGVVTDMLDRIRSNQERIIYMLKKRY